MAANIKRNSPKGRALQWAAAWNAASQKHKPVAVADKYVWLRLITRSDLRSTTRLIAHTLCLHGRQDGSNIYPSTRMLADESGTTERAVCTHLNVIVRAGYLFREQRKTTGRDWAMTLYTLCAPKAVLDAPENEKLIVPEWEVDPTWRPSQGTERGSVPSGDDVPQEAGGAERGAQGTERHAQGTERGSTKALNDVQPSLSFLVSQRVSQESVLQAAPRADSLNGKNPEPEVLHGEAKNLLSRPPRINPSGEPLDDEKLKHYVGLLFKAGNPPSTIVATLCQRAHHDRIRRCLVNDFGVPWIPAP